VAPAKGFIDGNLVESFLELSEDQMLRVAQELDMALEEVVRKIETLSRAIH
jgi:DNA damage-binding protein 1